MSRLLTILIAATAFGAAPASAMSIQLGFPTLTYPTQPSPDVGQACNDLTLPMGDTCATTK